MAPIITASSEFLVNMRLSTHAIRAWAEETIVDGLQYRVDIHLIDSGVRVTSYSGADFEAAVAFIATVLLSQVR